MEFRWIITSRTGDSYEGVDVFPTEEQRSSANHFQLFLYFPCVIQAPYGMTVFGTNFEISIPDDSILVFKRRVRMDMCGAIEKCKQYNYIIAFEKV